MSLSCLLGLCKPAHPGWVWTEGTYHSVCSGEHPFQKQKDFFMPVQDVLMELLKSLLRMDPAPPRVELCMARTLAAVSAATREGGAGRGPAAGCLRLLVQLAAAGRQPSAGPVGSAWDAWNSQCNFPDHNSFSSIISLALSVPASYNPAKSTVEFNMTE